MKAHSFLKDADNIPANGLKRKENGLLHGLARAQAKSAFDLLKPLEYHIYLQERQMIPCDGTAVGLNMNSPIITAIIGAFSAAIVSGIIKAVQWYGGHKALIKAIKIGIYHEIEHHHIIELEKDEDSSPNFVLTGFQNHFYNSNISNITKLLSEDLVHMLTFYYSNLTLVVDYQERLSKFNSEIKELSEYDPTTGNLGPKFPITPEEKSHLKFLVTVREENKHVLKVLLAPSMFTRQKMLLLLKGVFKNDPSQRQFIDVLPEHQAWWEKIQKEEGEVR